MSKLTQFLQKAGLVESEDAPFELPPDLTPDPAPPVPDVPVRAPIQAKTSGRADFSVPAADAPSAPSGEPDTSDYVLAEGVPIDTLYQQANIEQTSFPIERLQKLIDGLRQLDPTTQKAAVLAMDAADDTWTIEGVLKDA
ncbi:MAG TPA: hypothetical protein VLA79_16240, partial [Polyangia bacterium]|nr:hypothetical protein [Polyangia bacterium]